MEFKKLIPIATGLYIFLFICLANAAIIDTLVLFPSKKPIASKYKKTILSNESEKKIEVFESIPISPQAIVLHFHGNASRAERELETQYSIWQEKAHLIAVNFPGYGASTGPATLNGFVNAANTSYAYAKQQAEGKNIPIIFSGNSIGTLAVIEIAARLGKGGVVLRNPPPLKQLILQEHGWWNLFLLAYPLSLAIPDSSDSLQLAKKVNVPVVFLQSEKDREVPVYLQNKILEELKSPLKFFKISSAGHNTRLNRSQIHEIQPMLDWLVTSASR